MLAKKLDDLKFADLRRVNLARLPVFRNARGEPAHAHVDGSDWTLAEWTNAIAGEAGEACNLSKKMRRGDFGPASGLDYANAARHLSLELADVVVYSDIACFRTGHDLGAVVREKFNLVSDRVSCSIKLDGTESDDGILARAVRREINTIIEDLVKRGPEADTLLNLRRLYTALA